MSANEFEKQVQKQLEQFQLSPSASVWQNVEKQIREKKRRRVVLFILLPLALGLIGFSFYEFLYTGKKTELTQQTKESKEENLPAPGPHVTTVQPKGQSVPGTSATTNREAERTDGEQTTGINDKSIPGGKDVAIANTNKRSLASDRPGASRRKNAMGETNNVAPASQKDQPGQMVVTSEGGAKKRKATPGEPLKPEEPVKVMDMKDVAAPDAVAAANPVDNNNAAVKDIVAKTKDSSVADITVTEEKKDPVAKKKKEPSKIKWGIDFSAGFASNNKKTLTFAGANAFDSYYATPGVSSGSGNLPVAVIPPSSVKPGAAFRLGLVGLWKFSKRSSISSGVQYAYSSNRMKVGKETDTTVMLQSSSNFFSSTRDVNGIYRGAQQNDYTNSYHFIQLPVWYHWQVNKGKKIPVQINTGMSVGYLVATNALVYNGTLGGIYFKDRKAFSKWHYSLGTGISFRFAAKNSSELVIGPELSFDMSRLVKKDNTQYLMFGGVNAKWFFPKKKSK